jgi:hypothetical protein
MARLLQNVTECEAIIGYTFINKQRCAIALNAAGPTVLMSGSFEVIPRNDLMAVYGDSVIASHLCRRWYETGIARGKVLSLNIYQTLLTITKLLGQIFVMLF